MESTLLPLTLKLFGIASLCDGQGQAISLTTKKNTLLLAVLTLADGLPQSRQTLAKIVWPDSDPKSARESLRTALAQLRKLLPENALEADIESVTLCAGAIDCDATQPIDYRKYPGDFMEGYDQDWAIDHRLRFRNLYAQDAVKSAKNFWTENQHDQALAAIEEACRIDPFDQEAVAVKLEFLQQSGQAAKAAQVSDTFRARILRDLGVISDLHPQEETQNKEVHHPVVAAAEWMLDRNPDEALALLAATESQWLSMATEKALTLHWRTLAASKQTGTTRTTVEAQHAYLLSLSGKLGPYLAHTEEIYRQARNTCSAATCFRLAAAITYAHLSKGNFEIALTCARETLAEAKHHNIPFLIAEAELLLAIIEVHVGDPETGYRRTGEAFALVQTCGDAFANASYSIVYAGSLIEARRLDEASRLMATARRTVEASHYERVRAWVLHGEAALAEAAGDHSLAREKLLEIKALGPEVAGHSVIALADDLLTKVDCQLREFDTAAEALARATAYRNHLGTVASTYELTQTAPSIRVLQERLGQETLRAIYRRIVAS